MFAVFLNHSPPLTVPITPSGAAAARRLLWPLFQCVAKMSNCPLCGRTAIKKYFPAYNSLREVYNYCQGE